MKNFIKSIFEYFNKQKIVVKFLFLFAFVLSLYLFLIIIFKIVFRYINPFFDDVDKENLVQIALLCGALLAIIEAIELRKVEFKPILNLHIKGSPSNDNGKYYEWCYKYHKLRVDNNENGYYLSVRNTGKGTAFNIKVLRVLDHKSNQVVEHGIVFSNSIIAPDSEIALNLSKVSKEYRSLNDFQFFFEVESVMKDKTFWRFIIRDDERRVEYLKSSTNESQIFK